MESSELKQILYVTSEEQAINYKWEEKAHYLSPNIGVVSIHDIVSMKNRGVIFMTDSLPVTEGMVLSMHPYKENCYIDINMTEDQLIREKLDCIACIAKYLGVRRFSAYAEFLEESKRELNADGAIAYKVVESEISYKQEMKERYARDYRRTEEFKGYFSRESYAKAKEEIDRNRLNSNSEIMYLLKQRDPDDENQLEKQAVRIELTNELNSLTEIAFSLNVMPVFSLKARYQETISKRKKVILKTILEFN